MPIIMAFLKKIRSLTGSQCLWCFCLFVVVVVVCVFVSVCLCVCVCWGEGEGCLFLLLFFVPTRLHAAAPPRRDTTRHDVMRYDPAQLRAPRFPI